MGTLFNDTEGPLHTGLSADTTEVQYIEWTKGQTKQGKEG